MLSKLRVLISPIVLSAVFAVATAGQLNAVDVPVVKTLSPGSAQAGTNGLTLTVNGSLFHSMAKVHWNGSPRQTTVVSSGKLTAVITATDLANAGTATVFVRDAKSLAQSGNLTFTITPKTTTSAPSPLQIATTTLPTAGVSAPYSTGFAAIGGTAPYTWTLVSGGLPAGMTLSSTGVLSGTASSAGTFTFSVTAKDSASSPQAATSSFSLTVTSGAPVVSTAALPSATVNQGYAATLVAAGGTTPYSWSLAGGTLPTGTTLSTSGAISGTPTATGTFSFTAAVRDASGRTASAAKTITVASAASVATSGIWISKEEIMARPMSGTAWTNLKSRADGSWGAANIADQNSQHDTNTLAGALVYVRTGVTSYRDKVISNLVAAIGSDNNYDADCTFTPNMARSMSVGRNLAAYVIAADLVNLRATSDPNSPGSRFAAWVNSLRFKKNCPNTGAGNWQNLGQAHDEAPSNGNAMAGGARLAAALYMGDKAEVAKAWETYQRYVGDSSKCLTCQMTFNPNGKTWAADPNRVVGVNPVGATKNGHRIDGAIPNDIGRGGAFAWPPGYTQYPWEGLQGMFMQAQLLSRAGYPAWTIQNNAPLRALDYVYWLAADTGDSTWTSGGTANAKNGWVVWLGNKVYGKSYPGGAATGGKNMSWTDWTHGK